MYARHHGLPRPHYAIKDESRKLTVWRPLHKGVDGSFTLDGVEYLVDVGGTTHAELSVAGHGPVAVADGIGRTPWVVHGDGRTHVFERTLDAWWEQVLVDEYREPVGVVRRTGRHGRSAEAELPGMSAPVAVFAIAVALTTWREASSRAAR
jgi:hypothetical protein